MTDSQKKIGIGVVAAILCIVAFYFLYWVKTPAYSLNIIREAAQKHDVNTFERHVDLDSIMPKMFDDAIIAQQEISGEKIMDNPFAAAIIQGIKPQAVSYLKNEVLKQVKGEDTTKENASKKDKNAIAENISKKVAKQTNEIKDISVVSKDSGIATVVVKIFDPSIDGQYDIKLKMSQLDDGKWKVKEISNTAEFMVQIDKLYNAKLDKLNKPIKEELAKAVTSDNLTLSPGTDNNPFFATNWINYGLNYTNKSGKEIAHFRTVNKIKTADGKVVRTKYLNYRKPFKPDESLRLSYQDKLNPFIDSDKVLINNVGDKTLSSELVYLKYADGTEVKLLTSIPEPKPNKK